MTERRTGEGLQAIGSLAQGSRLLCFHELPVPRARGPRGQPHSSGRRQRSPSHTAQVGGSPKPGPPSQSSIW